MTGPSVQLERDLYARLLRLASADDVDAVLEQALEVAVAAVGATKGYLAIYGPERGASSPPRWWRARGCTDEDVESIRQQFSGTIIDDTLERRRVIIVPSAMGHPEYMQADSVRMNQITSVLCAPVGTDGLGVLYLQERAGGGIFEQGHEDYVVRFGQLIGPSIDRVVRHRAPEIVADPTTIWRRGGRFASLAGRSEEMGDLLRQATRVAASDDPVLIEGPPGVGKSVLARAIHDASARVDGPFVEVAVDPELELDPRPGGEGAHFLDVARGGTLYLHHVDRLSRRAQSALLELLEHDGGEGSVRVMASTSRELADLVVAGGFRGEVVAALGGCRLCVPGLDKRSADLAVLVEVAGRRIAAEHHKAWMGVGDEALEALRGHRWTAHVRELLEGLDRAIQNHDGGAPLAYDAFFERDRGAAGEGGFRMDGPLVSWREALASFKEMYVRRALELHGGNATAAAKALGISRSRMFALLNELGIRREDAEKDASSG